MSMSHVDDGMLHAYLDGELAPADARGVDAHMAQCPDCRRRLDEERALIARAAELLALATPPDRQVPPFRAGDVKAPTRVWWRVRLPLAWAATVALALGIGSYLGREAAPPRLAETATDSAAARPGSLARRESRPEARGTVRTPRAVTSAPAAVSPAPGGARADNIAPRRAEPVVPRADTDAEVAAYTERRSLDAAARSILQGKASRDERNPWQKGNAITVDSARRVLGANPLFVPGVPIEAIYHGRRNGFSSVVIVEQALDSATMIEVINARPAPAFLNGVVAAGAPARSQPAETRPRPAPQAAPSPDAGLFHDVRGPVSADSLAALRRLLQPLRPATEP